MLCFGNISFESILWFCASGESFFAGVCLLILTLFIHSGTQRKVSLYGVYFLYIFALLAIILSSTPLHPLFYILWLSLFIVWQIAVAFKKYKTVLLGFLVAMSLMSMLLELPWQLSKQIPIYASGQIYVIGDSISAGMGNKDEKTWPILLSEELQIPTINLSIAGATAGSALKQQVPKVLGEGNLVLLEIGGNDMLNYNSPEEYERSLTEIIQHLQGSSSQIVWFELPLLPHYYIYGRIQRKLARKHNITLIPKLVLASVFSTLDATSDGMHLTPKGHEVMAHEIHKLIRKQ